jgi:hypothetical protein
LETDDTVSPSERELEKMYFIHWRERLQSSLLKEGSGHKEPTQPSEKQPLRRLNQVKPSDESWKVITPPALLRAVMNIRKDFQRRCDAQRDYFQEQCFKDLHPLASSMTEPAVFRNYFYGCIERIREIVKFAFGRFLEISLNQDGLIGAAPVQWASLQTFDLIEVEDRLVEAWIKSACDKPSDCHPKDDQEFMEKVVFRTDWRAPQETRDNQSMYRRLEEVSWRLGWLGLNGVSKHESNYATMLHRLAGSHDIAALRVLADVVEPTKDYTRTEVFPQPPVKSTPLNRLADAARPESAVARQFAELVETYLQSGYKDSAAEA